MSREIELKLEISPDAAERVLRQSWLDGAGCSSIHQLSTYYDTSDGALRGRGFMLRVRSAGDVFIQTVKSLADGAGLFERGEWEYQTGGPDPDAAKLSHTPLAGVDVAQLRPVIRSEVKRTICRLDVGGAQVELDLDEGSIAAGHEQPICEVEIELIRGDPRSVLEIARRVADAVPAKLGVMSKVERGFALADGKFGRITKAEPVRVEAAMTVAQGFAAIINACLRHFRLNEPLVIDARTPEALHQARVAMRRLRSALSLFRTAISDEEFPRIREELRWFTAQLGDARNLDVFLQREDLAKDQRSDLLKRREAAYDQVIRALESRRLQTLMLDLVEWTGFGEWREHSNARLPLEPYVSRRIDRLWHKIRAAHHLSRLDDEALHQLRILIKKLRYALEFVSALHHHESERRKRFGRSLQELQESLGLLNDSAVARTMVAAEAWPMLTDDRSQEERGLLREAEHELHQLREIGPYWR